MRFCCTFFQLKRTKKFDNWFKSVCFFRFFRTRIFISTNGKYLCYCSTISTDYVVKNIPGFYGLGSAIKLLKKEKKGRKIKQLYRNSLFFRTIVENSMTLIPVSGCVAVISVMPSSMPASFEPVWGKHMGQLILRQAKDA